MRRFQEFLDKAANVIGPIAGVATVILIIASILGFVDGLAILGAIWKFIVNAGLWFFGILIGFFLIMCVCPGFVVVLLIGIPVAIIIMILALIL